MMASEHAVEWTARDHTAPEPVIVGDVVSAEAGGMPIYRVLALESGRAWVAAVPGAPPHAMSLKRFQWRATIENERGA